MTTLFVLGFTNAAIATILAIVVWLTTRVCRQPALAQLLWALVLVKLVTPPIVAVPWHFRTSSAMVDVLTATSGDASASDHTMIVASAKGKSAETSSITKEPGDDTLLRTTRTSHSVESTAIDRAPSIRTSDVNDSVNGFVYWIPRLMSVWIAGSATWLLIAIVRLTRFHRAICNAGSCPDEICRLADRTAAKLGVSGRFRVRMTDARLSPLVWPIGQPTIV